MPDMKKTRVPRSARKVGMNLENKDIPTFFHSRIGGSNPFQPAGPLNPMFISLPAPNCSPIDPHNSKTYLSCGEFDEDAIDASADRPGSCGREALWWREEFCVEVDDGRLMGSKLGSECRPSSTGCAVLNGGRSRTCSREDEGRRWSMAEAL
jgi:hypothetical protein